MTPPLFSPRDIPSPAPGYKYICFISFPLGRRSLYRRGGGVFVLFAADGTVTRRMSIPAAAVTTFFAVTIRPGDGPRDGRAVPRVLVRRVLGRDVRHRRATAAVVRSPGRRPRDHHPVRPDAVQAGDRGRHDAPVRRRRRRARPVVAPPRLLQGRGDPAGHENVEAARTRRRRRNGKPVRRHRRAAQGRLLGAARRPAPQTRLLPVGGPSAAAAVAGRGPLPDVLAAADVRLSFATVSCGAQVHVVQNGSGGFLGPLSFSEQPRNRFHVCSPSRARDLS